MSVIAAKARENLEQVVQRALDAAPAWAETPLQERIDLLEALLPRVVAEAPSMVADAAQAKGYTADSVWAAEDWANGPWAIAQFASASAHVLRRIASGKPAVPRSAVRRRANGRIIVDVFPVSTWDRLLLNGYHAEVWMDEGVSPSDVGIGQPVSGSVGVSLVLGAGNVVSITALDILNRLYETGHVVVAKMNPVNAYMRPHLEAIFADFLDAGFVQFVDGGAEEGTFLAHHDRVDDVHLTGSAATHDALVWGVGEELAERKVSGVPVLDKPISSELGGVSPCIVVPGNWSDADFRYQAELIVTSKVNNAGHNCIATQVLVLPRDWNGTTRLLAEIRMVMASLPPRVDYYPGAEARRRSVAETHANTVDFSEDGCGMLVIDVQQNDELIHSEVFASVLAVVTLPESDASGFLAAATAFANERLPGTLGATLIIDPRTERAHRDEVDSAIRDLRYGTLGVNVWSGFGFLLGYTPWGAFPGNSAKDIGSGRGFVHNAFMLDKVERTVLRGPFAPLPRGLFHGSPSI